MFKKKKNSKVFRLTGLLVFVLGYTSPACAKPRCDPPLCVKSCDQATFEGTCGKACPPGTALYQDLCAGKDQSVAGGVMIPDQALSLESLFPPNTVKLYQDFGAGTEGSSYAKSYYGIKLPLSELIRWMESRLQTQDFQKLSDQSWQKVLDGSTEVIFLALPDRYKSTGKFKVSDSVLSIIESRKDYRPSPCPPCPSGKKRQKGGGPCRLCE